MCLYCPQGLVSSGSLLVSDQPIVDEDGFLPMSNLEDLGLEDLVEEKKETFTNEVEEYGSGSREEKEGSEEQEKQVLKHAVPVETSIRADFQPHVSEEKEKTKNESDLKMRNDSQFEDVGEDGKKTWYFWM